VDKLRPNVRCNTPSSSACTRFVTWQQQQTTNSNEKDNNRITLVTDQTKQQHNNTKSPHNNTKSPHNKQNNNLQQQQQQHQQQQQVLPPLTLRKHSSNVVSVIAQSVMLYFSTTASSSIRANTSDNTTSDRWISYWLVPAIGSDNNNADGNMDKTYSCIARCSISLSKLLPMDTVKVKPLPNRNFNAAALPKHLNTKSAHQSKQKPNTRYQPTKTKSEQTTEDQVTHPQPHQQTNKRTNNQTTKQPKKKTNKRTNNITTTNTTAHIQHTLISLGP
jgi:hypothetical protein